MPRRVVRPLPSLENQLHELDSSALVGQVRSLLAEAQALSARLAALNEVTLAMQTDLSFEGVLQVVTREARWLLDFQYCSVALCSSDGATYQEQVLLGEQDATRRGTYARGAGVIGQALVNGHALVLHELNQADAPLGMRSALIVPLRSGGSDFGTLNFYATSPRHYSQADLRFASAFAGQISAALQNSRMFASVQQARNDLRTVLESISDAVLVIDADARVRLINRSAQRMFSVPEKGVVGRPALWFRRVRYTREKPLIPPETFRDLVRAWQAQPRTAASGTCQLADGRHFEWAYAPLRGVGIAAGAVVSFRDISARVELEQMRDDMLHMLVHDLRTPLTGVIMGIDMLMMPGDFVPPDERHALLSQTYRAAESLLEQLNTVLDVRRLEVGRMELDLVPLSVADLIEYALQPMKALIQHNKQTLQRWVGDDLPVVAGDVRLLQRVLENFLGNAIKFASLEGELEIGARYQADAGCVRVWVGDNGPGVPEVLRERIFEKYSQAPGEERRGTGLGLAFCKLVIVAHEGTIGMEDRPDGGSIFWFDLPVHAEDAATPHAE